MVLAIAISARDVFISGGTGYMGRRLIPFLTEGGHRVRALVRAGSEHKLPPGCTSVLGDALKQATFVSQIQPADTFIQLVGVAHPSPAQAAKFRTVDMTSIRAKGEALLRAIGLNATLLRPWYVLGSGHRLVPFYWLCEGLPATWDSARRLGLVTLPQMLSALLHAVNQPANGVRILGVPEIRSAR